MTMRMSTSRRIAAVRENNHRFASDELSVVGGMIGVMEEFELPDGRKVRFTDRVLESDLDDHDDCPFCLGRATAYRGDGEENNPFPPVDAAEGSVEWYESDYGLWRAGHDLGSTEPDGLLWYEQPKQIRARARARRRADHAQGGQWSAVKAAAALVHKRDEVLARASDNPLKITVEKAHLADTLHRYMKRFVDRGADPDEARFLALTTVTHSSGLSHDDPDLIEGLERQQRSGELSPLRVGESYVISPAMHATVAAAAQTLTKENIIGWRTDDLLTERGVLLLPHIQLVHAAGNPMPDEIVMLSWGTGSYIGPLEGPCYRVLYLTVWFDADGPVQVPEFTAARNFAAKHGHPFPSFGVAASRRCGLDLSSEHVASLDGEHLTDVVKGVAGEQQSSAATVGEYSGEVIEDVDVGEWAHKYLFAFMGLAQQRIATVQPWQPPTPWSFRCSSRPPHAQHAARDRPGRTARGDRSSQPRRRKLELCSASRTPPPPGSKAATCW
jgi:hypothetical protein